LYFPTGLALESTRIERGAAEPEGQVAQRLVPPRYLYVASSDFDLQYRSSGLISFDLDKIAAAVPRNCSTSDECNGSGDPQTNRCDTPDEAKKVPGLPANYVPSYVCVPNADIQPCGSVGEQGAADRLLYPGRCKPLDQHPFIRSTVGIGAFATDVVFAEDPFTVTGEAPRKRLFLPVRGDATLHWIDLNDGLLECDQQSTSDGSCGDSHRAGHEPSASNNNETQPSEPFGIAVTETGDYVAMTNQTSGSVSLYTHDWNSAVGPQLVNILGGLPQAPVAIAAVPQVFDVPDAEQPDDASYLPPQGFLVAYRNAAQIDLLRVRNDGPLQENYNRYSLAYAGSAPINLNSLGYDSRDIVIDDRERKDRCADQRGTPDYLSCLRRGKQPSVYIANRTPATLLVGAMASDASYKSGSSDLPAFTESVPLTPGPSRVVRGAVKVPAVAHVPDATHGFTDEHGSFDLEPRVFIVCFDSTRIYVYDPTRHVIDSIIDTGRGPYALAIDEARGLGYVGFFTDSYLGVISLDQRFRQTYASVIANIGPHTPPRSSK